MNSSPRVSQAIRTKTAVWQSNYTTEVTTAPSAYKFRDFADEKYLKRFVLNFHVDNSQQLQTKVAKDQADLRQTRTPPKPPKKFKSLNLVFNPLDKEESMGTDHTKAFMTGVNKEYVDPNKKTRDDRRLRMAFPELMQKYDPKPKLFVRNFRALKSTDTNEVLGEFIDPRPCIGIDKMPEPMEPKKK